ncbi:MAG TPA: DUF6440 family protein [Clostridia bacterium]|nr:DUF6440 family protein [Clostridia bacterium]
MARSDKRFIRVYTDSRFSGSNEIWVDTQTGVNYLFHYSGYAGGMTVLLDETGKPVVTPRYEVENLIYENR